MTDDTTLRIERWFEATPEAVFRVWTEKAAMERWYRDGPDFVANVTELDVRVGGRYRVEFGPAGQPPYVEHGEYLEVSPPSRLVMSETLEVDGGWADTRVTVELVAEGGKTKLVLTHTGFPTVEHRDAAGGGWPGFLDRIEDLLAT